MHEKKALLTIFFSFFFFKSGSAKRVHFEADRCTCNVVVGQERTSFEATRREIDQYRVKVEGLSQDVNIAFSSLNVDFI